MRDSLVAFLACTWPLLALYIAAQWLDLRTMRDERDGAQAAADDANALRRHIEQERDAAVERNAYLTERNMQLTYDLLARNVGKSARTDPTIRGFMFGTLFAWLHDWVYRNNPQSLAIQAMSEENARLHRDLAAAHDRIRELLSDKEFYYNAFKEGNHRARRPDRTL